MVSRAMGGMAWTILLGGLAAVGCNGASYEGDQRAHIYGDVTYKGEKVDLGMIYFKPLSASDGGSGTARPSSAVIRDGKYDIPEGDGPNLDSYRVELLWQKEKPGEKPPGAEEPPRENVLPEKYNVNSELTYKVESGDVKKDWALD